MVGGDGGGPNKIKYWRIIMGKLCFFEGQLCQVTKVESGYLLTIVPTIETFEASKTPVKPVKETAKKKIDLTAIESKAAPIENKKETAIKPTNKAKNKTKKIDIVQTQSKSNTVKNGNYRVLYNPKKGQFDLVHPDNSIVTIKAILDTKNFKAFGYKEFVREYMGVLSDVQDLDCMKYANTPTECYYIITVLNKTSR